MLLGGDKHTFGLRVVGVPLGDVVHVLLEGGVAGLELSHGVGFVVSLHPLRERCLVLLLCEAVCEGYEQCKN